MGRDLNYYDTFIAVAEDCPRAEGTPPKPAAKVSVAQAEFALVAEHPYEHDQNDVLFAASIRGQELSDDERAAARDAFFAKPQPCVRASPLGKSLGWGIHADAAGRIAIYGVETAEYARLAADPALAHTRAMRSKRAT